MLESGKQNLSDADFHKLAAFIYDNYGIRQIHQKFVN